MHIYTHRQRYIMPTRKRKLTKGSDGGLVNIAHTMKSIILIYMYFLQLSLSISVYTYLCHFFLSHLYIHTLRDTHTQTYKGIYIKCFISGDVNSLKLQYSEDIILVFYDLFSFSKRVFSTEL